jgi:hypothetical protein
MNCPRVSRKGRPAPWLHALVCAECRAALRADEILAFGIVQLRKPTASLPTINRTLAALNLSALPEDYRLRLRRRRRAQARRSAALSGTLSLLAWLGYIGWMPRDLPAVAPHPESRACRVLTEAAASMQYPGKIGDAVDAADAIHALESRTAIGPLLEAETVHRFVSANARAIDVIHANLTAAYSEKGLTSIEEMRIPNITIYTLTTLLRADAASKLSTGDRLGALDAALNMITFGENTSGAGSVMSRLQGERCQGYGRALIWRLLPQLSAEEAVRASRQIEKARRYRAPLRSTLQWEGDSGLAVRMNLLNTPLWRWRAAPTLMGMNDSLTPTQHLAVTGALYLTSNHRILRFYLDSMDAAARDWRRPRNWEETEPRAALYDLVNDRLGVFLSQVPLQDTLCETENALLTTALALQAYHHDHGSYPPALDALCPTYLAQVPADPFLPGTPLRYRADPPAEPPVPAPWAKASYGVNVPYRLYSVGPDGIDQRGVSTNKMPNGQGDIPAHAVQ